MRGSEALPRPLLLLPSCPAGWPPEHLSFFSPSHRMCPIFQISNVTGENLDLLKMFLNLLSPRTSYREEEPAEFQIDDTYSVPVRGFCTSREGGWAGTSHRGRWVECGGEGLSGDRLIGPGSSLQGVGTVVSGTTLRGLIKLNDTLLLGPDPLGNFLSIAVKSIHRKRMPVKEVRGGQTASFALKKVSVDNTLTPLRVRVLLGSGPSPVLMAALQARAY